MFLTQVTSNTEGILRIDDFIEGIQRDKSKTDM